MYYSTRSGCDETACEKAKTIAHNMRALAIRMCGNVHRYCEGRVHMRVDAQGYDQPAPDVLGECAVTPLSTHSMPAEGATIFASARAAHHCLDGSDVLSSIAATSRPLEAG